MKAVEGFGPSLDHPIPAASSDYQAGHETLWLFVSAEDDFVEARCDRMLVLHITTLLVVVFCKAMEGFGSPVPAAAASSASSAGEAGHESF